jgi:predicted aconitase with swiveling domain
MAVYGATMGCGPMTDSGRMAAVHGRVLFAGVAAGRALVLDQPLSFWGGIDQATGLIIDHRHPSAGAIVTRRVLLMPSGRGSSSSSSVLAEAIRAEVAPAAILLLEPDPILVVGAIVAKELYGRALPIVMLDQSGYRDILDGDLIKVDATGALATVTVTR